MGLVILALTIVITADEPATSAKEPLKKVASLVGDWKGSGTVDGRRNDFWLETIHTQWKHDQTGSRLLFHFVKGKFFTTAELRYSPKSKQYQLDAVAADNSRQQYVGDLTVSPGGSRVLTLERNDPDTKTLERLSFTLLHDNRYLYRFETRPQGASSTKRVYQVGATKLGEPFAKLEPGRTCIVSGGAGSIRVEHMGRSYYVCCSGCKDAFLADPTTYIAEAVKSKPD